ncbi:deoxyribodipyrimidine photo-lyase [Nocardia farcinica]|uniref:cryptochrome/photolyase family protein n=1 Tax=Nocardia farcinica TaxID=37329 RepID=UPI001893096C|nr:deoxyribodipyrimidine photo-lyase [Nocardia farcinica]MBF6069779.1 deoxyribodipyrimidine photo-lyase [Nocardia farcinica]MBF6270425.1 deoxyribodipyrimidine photo-lyase [Nocardia farcinica]MBF6418005.1 deoxyribodipyrimidine photo-lyase [Nocardia farcinica]MBF6429482.1 deoxyribodipyrimidine photo-lyase [Nocardia farcinica]MBF6500066.1 deoxyribodipyrimidine photo-lyase [Nocardia farcinica]
MTAIALFTRDLRVHDNPVLAAARDAGDAVVPLFVVDAHLVPDRCPPNRARFLAAAVRELDAELRTRGGRLIVRRGVVADEVARVVDETGARTVHLADDVSGYSAARADALRERLDRRGVRLEPHPASITTVDGDVLRPATGRDHFAVFTPYFRRWSEVPRRAPLPPPDDLEVPDLPSAALPAPESLNRGEPSPQLSVGGETTGRALLDSWLAGPVDDYVENGDDLAADATSHLSPYLHFGCLSPTELLHRVDVGSAGGQAFARQLAWRDFHHQLLAARPAVARHDYRPRPIRWRDDPQALAAWRSARTGFPIVDAALRQLHTEGWLPNRARLIAAAFLTKTLGLHWRAGAGHFLHWLVDADLANNQLNWQWVAGTGSDTRPNRGFNPLRQADRYDPDGLYVRRWIPELADLDGGRIHRPWRAEVDYPSPIAECPGM